MRVKVRHLVMAAAASTFLMAVSVHLRADGPLPARPVASPSFQSAAGASASPERRLIDQYCTACHNVRLKTAGLILDNADLNRVPEQADMWEKVVRKLKGGLMPPQGRPRPD